MEQKSNKGGRVLLAIILVLVLCTTALSVITMMTQFQIRSKVDKALDMNVDTGAEDDVVIADEFTIRSTLQISDAYKNGTADSLSDKDKETLDMAKDVLSKIIKDGMTDYEKEEAVYLWLTKEMKADTGILTVIPTSSEGADDPHDVLKNHNAVCVGYATTFRLFMQMMDIECKVIHNKDLFHSWDLVKLDDEWYHVDCYSDANNANYKNFNMNDTVAEKDHDWNHEFFPAATGVKYSYASMNSVELKNIYALPKEVRKLLKSKESTVAAYTFAHKISKDEEPEAIALVNAIQEYLSGSEDFYVELLWSENADGDYVLNAYVNYYNDDSNPDVSEQVKAKIDEAISDAFADFTFEFDEDNGDATEEAAETTKAYG